MEKIGWALHSGRDLLFCELFAFFVQLIMT